MIHNHLHKLQQAEKLTEISYGVRKKKVPYKKFNQVWIRADRPIGELYDESLKYSELQFYPNTNYKAWGVWLLMQLKLKKGSRKFSTLIGIGSKWFFRKHVYLPLQADIIYYRSHAAIMVYTSLSDKKVIKVALTKWGKLIMKSEVESQQLASSIKSKHVFITSIHNKVYDEHIHFSVEDYFVGKIQSQKDIAVLENNYYKAFQFLLELYLSHPIELQNLSESPFLNHDFVEAFILQQTRGAEIISVYKRLYAQEKMMVLCRIHGDLNHNNVLSNKDKVCIIDWGKSKHHYLFRDLDNSSFNTMPVYEQFIVLSKIDRDQVYPYYEQLFLEVFIEMCRLIHDGIKRKTIVPSFYILIDFINDKLFEISKKI
ncbi:MAG: RIO1 family regulatory kinase/ATPase [Gelidibacter sp.]